MADESSGKTGDININLESNSSYSIPNNEEIIEEITKGLEDSAIKRSDCTASEEKEMPKENGPDSNKDSFEDFDQSDDEQNSVKDDDFIDEEALKDAEIGYSDEERESLRLKADELKLRGNEQFKSGEHVESAGSYTLALRTCPFSLDKERAVLYSNRAAAKMKLGLLKSAVGDCSKAVELNPSYLKAYFRRAQLYEETEKLDEALADYNKILELDPLHREANIASRRLPGQINERNEKLKVEMMGKLKDLGNMILRPFGLSTNNFQLNQDPGSGGYSINFKQNAE